MILYRKNLMISIFEIILLPMTNYYFVLFTFVSVVVMSIGHVNTAILAFVCLVISPSFVRLNTIPLTTEELNKFEP